MAADTPTRGPSRNSEYDTSDGLGDLPRRKFSAGGVIGAVVLASVFGALFNASALFRLAERQDPGAFARGAFVSAAETNLAVAGFTRLDRVPDLFDRAINGPDRTPTLVPAPVSPTPTTVAPVESTTTTTAPPVRVATRHPVSSNSPLELYVGGDSVGKDLAEALARVTPVELVEPELGARVSTGLTRPDFYDWPAAMRQVAEREDPPDQIVFLVGSNDWQDKFEIDDRGSDAWADYYRSQVAAIMDSVAQAGDDGGAIPMIWVTLPPIRNDKMNPNGVDLMNRIYTSEADARSWVEIVDGYEMFGGFNGFTESLGGERVRQDDGIHLNFAGINLLADSVFDRIKKDWSFPPDS